MILATAISNAVTALAVRVKKLEDAPAGADYSAEITKLVARMNAIEAKVCPQEARIVAIEQDHVSE